MEPWLPLGDAGPGRGHDLTVALNLGDTDVAIDVGDAAVLLSVPRGLEGCHVHGTTRLASHTAMVLRGL